MKQPRNTSLIERAIGAIGSVASLVVHTILFIVAFLLSYLGFVQFETMLLVLTTIVSLEAIYLALFIQITVNRNTAQLREVEEDIDEIQEDVEELGEDVEGIQEDIEEISEDIDEIQEDVEEMTEEEKEAAGITRESKVKKDKPTRPTKSDTELLEDLAKDIHRLLRDLEELKAKK